MKVEDLIRPSALTVGVLGFAAGALLGYLAGVAVTRDPQAARRVAGQIARTTARGVEQAALAFAQTREHLADLWAEAREEARAEVDARDFAQAAQAAAATAAATATRGTAAAATASKSPPRRGPTPRAARTAPAAKATTGERRPRAKKKPAAAAPTPGPEMPGTA